MSIPGKRETGGRLLSTADLAAAARRRPDSEADGEEEPVLNEEGTAAARERGNERMQKERMREGVGTLAPETRPAQDRRAAEVAEADARKAGKWFGERGVPSASAGGAARPGEALEPLFTPELAKTYRSRWITIQSGFVDDPRQAVRSGDELVAQMMTNLADIFAEERHRVEAQLDSTGENSTEALRVTLRRYRSFFERLLSL